MADAFTHAKLRLQDRGMHDARLTPAARLVFYEILYHLNRVSGDAWPSEERIARNLGIEVRTVRRAIHGYETVRKGQTVKQPGLVELAYLTVEVDGRSNTYRPVFELDPRTPDKMSHVARDVTRCDAAAEHIGTPDKNAPNTGHFVNGTPDKNTPLSPLREPIERNPSRPSSSTPAFQSRASEPRGNAIGQPMKEGGRLRPQRGDERVEALIAKQLGPDGYDILGKLNEIDDGQPLLRLFSIARGYPNARIPQADLDAARLTAARPDWRRRA
jgi:hypothetical protein